jgi:general secretion pathway protein D
MSVFTKTATRFGQRRRILLLGWVLGWLALGAVLQPVFAAPVTLNLKNADINALISTISEITAKNFIVDPRVKGRVNVISAKPMDEKELYEVFLAILAVHGFAAVPEGRVIKIIPAAGAKQENIPTVNGGEPPEPDQVVTKVIQVRNVSAAQLVPILRPLIPPQGHLAAYTPTNVLIISDSAGNVERIANIIRRVDLASTEEVEIVPLRHASATDVVRVLTSLEQAKAQAAQAAGSIAPLRIVADERTNSILLSGDAPDRLRLRTLIAHLDTPLEAPGNTQVVYLRYAKAKDLLTVLQGVSKKLSEDLQKTGPGGQVSAPGQAPPQAAGAAGGGAGIVDIQADEATNALVITAPPEAFRSLKMVIDQLDIRRAQVLVEAAIAELSADKTAQLGVQWVVDGSKGGNILGFINFNLGTSLSDIANSISAFRQGGTVATGTSPLPTGAQLAVGDFNSSVRFAALISALASDAGNNVLSTPSLVTMDNEEAEIVVGQNVPFVTGSFTTSVGGSIGGGGLGTSGLVGNPFQTIQRQDVGLTLKIKPQINEGNAVRLEISQEVSNVVPSATALTQGPTTQKRAVKTTVMVENSQILVLGGLIDDSLSESIQKVPGLGDIPLVGNLFRYRTTSKNKRNLMIFLHPVILTNAIEGTLSTNEKYNYMRQEQITARQKGVALLPQAQTPVLPPQEQVRQRNTLLDTAPKPAPKPAEPKTAPAVIEQGFNNK